MADDEDINIYIAKNKLRLVPKFMKLFQRMDNRCRQMAYSNPGRPMADYCPSCQEMFKEVLKGEVK